MICRTVRLELMASLGLWLIVAIPSAVSCSRPDATEARHLFQDIGAVFLKPGQTDPWKVSHQFVVRNPFNEVVAVTIDAVSCGCSTCELGTKTISPGGRAMVKLETYLRYVRERSSEYADLCLVAREGAEHHVRLTLACDVFPQVVTSLPQVPYEFDLTTPFIPTTSEVDFFFYGPADVTSEPSLSFQDASNVKYVSLSSPRRVDLGGGVHRFDASLRLSLSRLSFDRMAGPYVIKADFDSSHLTAQLRFRRQTDYSCEPPVVYLSSARTAAEVSIRRRSESLPPLELLGAGFPISIESIRSDDPLVQRFRIELPLNSNAIPLTSLLSFGTNNVGLLECTIFAVVSNTSR